MSTILSSCYRTMIEFRQEKMQTPEEQAHHLPYSVEASNIGVKYLIGNRREDLQSFAYGLLLKRNRQSEFWALRNLSFSCYEGEILGIIGRNGAGKTTLCRVLSGLLKPDEGDILVKGTVSALLSLGAGFNPELTGRENIVLNSMMLGFSKNEARALASGILQFSGIGDFIDQPLKYYSSGMKSRLSFSIASFIEPDILVIDEVLGAGDIEFGERAGKRMCEIIEKSKTVIVVTHNMGFVERFCTRALWIDKGMVLSSGAPKKIVDEYREKFQRINPKRKLHFSKTKTHGIDKTILSAKNVSLSFHLSNRGKAYRGLEIYKSFFSVRERLFWALKSVTFEVKRGEVIGIIGRNGSGKTTLCRVINGIFKPDSGSIWVKGEINALLGYGTGFNPQLTVKDNIYLNGMILGISRKALTKMYPKIVEFSGLVKFIHEPIKNLSSGMKSRLGFSIASMIEPDFLILDEALGTGDIAFYEAAVMRIQELVNFAEAVIVVTHDMNFVQQVCTRVLWLDQGAIEFDGNPAEAVQKYRDSLKKT